MATENGNTYEQQVDAGKAYVNTVLEEATVELRILKSRHLNIRLPLRTSTATNSQFSILNGGGSSPSSIETILQTA
jgi:hypothetical protein